MITLLYFVWALPSDSTATASPLASPVKSLHILPPPQRGLPYLRASRLTICEEITMEKDDETRSFMPTTPARRCDTCPGWIHEDLHRPCGAELECGICAVLRVAHFNEKVPLFIGDQRCTGIRGWWAAARQSFNWVCTVSVGAAGIEKQRPGPEIMAAGNIVCVPYCSTDPSASQKDQGRVPYSDTDSSGSPQLWFPEVVCLANNGSVPSPHGGSGHLQC